MSDNPHRCVIDQNGFYVTFVLLVKQKDGSVTPYAYTMGEGEALIEATPPTMRQHAGGTGFIRPRWLDGPDWLEDASADEIAEWDAEHPAPEPIEVTPSADEILDIILGVTEDD